MGTFLAKFGRTIVAALLAALITAAAGFTIPQGGLVFGIVAIAVTFVGPWLITWRASLSGPVWSLAIYVLSVGGFVGGLIMYALS